MRFRLRVFASVLFPIAILVSGCGSKSSTLQNDVAVAIEPSSVSVLMTRTQKFTAQVSGTTETGVTWLIQDSAGGTIDSTGVYTAPNATGTFHVMATSTAQPSATATATVSVEAGPPPVFSSTPPTSAEYGQIYSYTLSAIDPAGGTVTFALTSGAGTVSGNTLAWTPTYPPSGVANFVVTAVTTEGGSATQSWSVTPTRTIIGTYSLVNVDPFGNTTAQSPQDLTGWTFAALVPDGTGGYSTFPGTGATNGTFTISGVSAAPGDSYWLAYGSCSGCSPAYFDQITTSNPVLGGFVGVPRSGITNGSFALAFDLTGFDTSCDKPCITGNYTGSEWWVPNLLAGGASTDAPYGGVVTATGSWTGPLMDASQGDAGYLLTSINDSDPDPDLEEYEKYIVKNSFGPVALTTPNGSTIPVDGAVYGPNQGVAPVNGFEALRLGVNPNWPYFVNCNYWAIPSLLGNQFGFLFESESPYELFFQGFYAYASTCPGSSFGEVSNPFPIDSMPMAFEYAEFVAPEGGSEVGENWVSSNDASSTMFPAVGQVSSPTINGADFYQNQTLTSTTPTISWSAPAVGRAGLYVVHVSWLAFFSTTSTQLIVPPGILAPGSTVNISIVSISDSAGCAGSGDVGLCTFSLNQGGATAVSGTLTVPGIEDPGRKAVRHGQQVYTSLSAELWRHENERRQEKLRFERLKHRQSVQP